MQPSDIAIALRRRTPWEAMDLGLAMLQRWGRQVYAPLFLVVAVIAALAWALGTWAGNIWVAFIFFWWMKPLYDRVVLHVLSRAVFGEVQGLRAVLRERKEWLGAGLLPYLLVRWWPDLSRSFSLPVRQLEGQRGGAGRERRGVLGRRVGNYATWLTLACMHFEAILTLSLTNVTLLFLPGKAFEGRDFIEAFISGALFSYGHLVAWAAAVVIVEPFYVAAGFALYLNRRTLLEGWDIEVALRKITQRHAAAVVLLVCCMVPFAAFAADKDPRREIAEVLKAPEFPHEVDTMQWQRRHPLEPRDDKPAPREGSDGSWVLELGRVLATVVRALFWILVVAAIVYAIWWAVQMLPRVRAPLSEPYRPPAALFGMEIAPEKLPADVGAAAAALARNGRIRDALALLYRGAISNLVHRRGVELLASHTELEALQLAQKRLDSDAIAYLQTLVRAWRDCAYARREPGGSEVERLATGFRVLAA
jgi:hypothetical protein